jgi:DNA-binding SARP family transcriptional activator
MPVLRRRLRRQASTVPLTPPKLYFQALGSVQVLVDGKPVTSAEWQAQVARDLLFCLLAHPKGLTKEAVGVIFWPESSPAQLKLHFKQTVYRLRRVLGQDVVLLDQDRYRINRALDYEYDVEVFLEKLAQAQATTDRAGRAVAFRAAADLYTGPYLPDVDGTWVYPEWVRLQQAFVKAVLAVAGFFLETGEYGATVDYCERVLAQDPCQEEAHRLVMRAYAAMGNQAAVTRQFERCRQASLQEANAPLAPQTEALYKRLTHH